jgi:hypothetical protein
MAHQVLFVKDDTAFNESFATAVDRLKCCLFTIRHMPLLNLTTRGMVRTARLLPGL